MAKLDVLDILRVKKQSPLEFEFDNLWIPPMYCYLTQQDIDELRSIATSIRLSSKIEMKYRMIDNIMRNRGFKRFSAGTNRIVYSFSEDDRFLVKIAVDKVGMQDNPMEFQNQFLLKPYVTKMFYTSPCGTVGFVERVLPIKNRAEFKEIADDVFEILMNKVLGEYVVEDIGTKYFMNWGIRISHGPVLLDYPYVYKLDGNKLFCNKLVDHITGQTCDGEIDYDCGFNHLVCTKCGKSYLACNLRDDSIENNIVIKGGNTMKVSIKKGDQTLCTSIASKDVITKPEPKNTNTTLKVRVVDSANNHKYSEPNKPKFNTPKISAKVVNNEEEVKNDKLDDKKNENQVNNTPKTAAKPSVKKAASKPELISVEENGDKVNIKFRVNVVEPKVEDEVESEDNMSDGNERPDDEEAPAEADADNSDYKYSEYDDDESSHKQNIRSKSTKKPSEEVSNNRKKSPTRIPKR